MDENGHRLDAIRLFAAAMENGCREKTNIPLPRLQHTFEDDGAFYFSTELVPGVSMSQLTEEQKQVVTKGAAGAHCYAEVAPIRHPRCAGPDTALCSQPGS